MYARALSRSSSVASASHAARNADSLPSAASAPFAGALVPVAAGHAIASAPCADAFRFWPMGT